MARVSSTTRDSVYTNFIARLQKRFEKNTLEHGQLFTVSVGDRDLWLTYLRTFSNQQYYNCHCCCRFMHKYGGLVVISDTGAIIPAMWHVADTKGTDQKAGVAKLFDLISDAEIVSPFYSSEKEWGQHESGGWNHLALWPAKSQIHTSAIKTAGQKTASKLEDFKNLQVARAEYSRKHVEAVVELLRTDTLYRTDKLLAPAEFFLSLYDLKHQNLFWKAVANAPDGFCHPKSSMFGTLLEDIASGMSFDNVKRRFEAKMHPLQYQRPQALPSAGNLKRAEELAAKLNLGPALERRVAKLEEVPMLWKPRLETHTSSGVFAHLKQKGESHLVIKTNGKRITWSRFKDEVLPGAKGIEIELSGMQAWYVFTTAVHAEAPPIICWDRDGERNPVSWYTWFGGAVHTQYGLESGWHKVSGVSRFPDVWGCADEGNKIMFFVDGARETRNAGGGLFPEHMRSDLHEVRSVIEAYSKSAKMSGLPEGSAVGIAVCDSASVSVRVTGTAVSSIYFIDRMK